MTEEIRNKILKSDDIEEKQEEICNMLRLIWNVILDWPLIF